MNRQPPHDEDFDDREYDYDPEEDFAQSEGDEASPIGRLMDDDVGFENEPSAYVRGFDRTPPPPLEPEPTKPAPPRRQRRERPASPRNEEFFANQDEETPEDDMRALGARDAARAARRRQPEPRPAVRAGTPTPRRMSGSSPQPRDYETAPRARQPEGEPPRRKNAPPPEDEYDTFRQRYRPGDLISSGGNRGEERGGDGRQPRRPAPAGRRAGAAAHQGEDGANMLRLILFGAVLVVLLIFIILIVRINTLANRSADATAQVESMEAAYGRYNNLRESYNAQNEELAARNADIVRLEGQLALANAANMPGSADGGGQGSASETPETPTEPVPEWPRQHVVVRGDNLGRIARYHYGENTPALVEHIQSYNNIRNPNEIQIGNTLTIPAPPGQ